MKSKKKRERGNDSKWREESQKRRDKEGEKKKKWRIPGVRAHEYLQDWPRKVREEEEDGPGVEEDGED